MLYQEVHIYRDDSRERVLKESPRKFRSQNVHNSKRGHKTAQSQYWHSWYCAEIVLTMMLQEHIQGANADLACESRPADGFGSCAQHRQAAFANQTLRHIDVGARAILTAIHPHIKGRKHLRSRDFDAGEIWPTKASVNTLQHDPRYRNLGWIPIKDFVPLLLLNLCRTSRLGVFKWCDN